MSDPTPVLGEVSPDDLDPTVRQQIERPRGWVPRLFGSLAFAPPLLRSWVALSNVLRGDTTLERRERALVVLLVASATRSTYEWSHHSTASRPHVSAEEVEAVASWPAPHGWSGPDEALLRVAAAVVADERLPDDAVALLVATRGRRFVVEVVATAAHYVAVGRIARALDLAPDPPPG